MAYNIISLGVFYALSINMKTSDMIKELCNKKNISVSEFSGRIGQASLNFGKKLKRDTVALEN